MKATYDNIHFTTEIIDGYDKDFNIVQSARSTGKSTKIFKKGYNYYQRDYSPFIVLRRLVADITESYIDDQLKVINKFRGDNEKLKFYYKASTFKEGVVDIYLSAEDLKNKEHVFMRVIGLSAKMQKLKGGVLSNVSMIIFDEFMIDVRNKEKYLADEIMRFKELYTTYRREAKNQRLKVWFLGNAYSYYSPYHAYFKIPTDKIKMGCILTGNTWIYNLYQPCEELIEQLKSNPLYDIDDKYEQYALYGKAINDEYIQIEKVMPRNFSLFAVFKVASNLIGVYSNRGNEGVDFSFWCEELSEWREEYRRKAMTFDISDMTSYTYIPSRQIVSLLFPVKRAINNRDIYYKSIGASYILEMLYNMLPTF